MLNQLELDISYDKYTEAVVGQEALAPEIENAQRYAGSGPLRFLNNRLGELANLRTQDRKFLQQREDYFYSIQQLLSEKLGTTTLHEIKGKAWSLGYYTFTYGSFVRVGNHHFPVYFESSDLAIMNTSAEPEMQITTDEVNPVLFFPRGYVVPISAEMNPVWGKVNSLHALWEPNTTETYLNRDSFFLKPVHPADVVWATAPEEAPKFAKSISVSMVERSSSRIYLPEEQAKQRLDQLVLVH